MPFRAWCVAVAIGLTAASVSGTGYGQSYPQDPNRAEYPQNYSAIADLPFHVSSDGETADPGCDKGHDDRKSDLCAQWKAADAAADSAHVAWLQFWIGSTVSALTLLAAIAAAVYAGAAAHHTASSVTVAENLGRRGLRAYMDVHAAQWGHSDDKPPASLRDIQARITVRNAGQTPAKNVVITRREKTIGTFIATEAIILESIASARTDDSNFSVEAGGVVGYKIDNIANAEEAHALMTGEAHCYFMGRITYTDVFDKPQESTWCLRVENFGTDRVRIFPYKYGNRTT